MRTINSEGNIGYHFILQVCFFLKLSWKELRTSVLMIVEIETICLFAVSSWKSSCLFP